MTILYSRKSTESEDRQVLSIESQINELKRLALSCDLSIDKLIQESKSAKAPGRSGFDAMIKMIESSSGVILLCWKLDRLARNPHDAGKIAWLLQQGIIKEIKTPERSYFPSDNVLLMSFEFGMANQYIRDLSTNVKRGMKTKLEKGGWTHPAPFGYINNKVDKTIELDPVRAPLVSEIFSLFASGAHSLKEITELMHLKGLKSRGGLKIPRSLIYRIITNPFYMGIMLRAGKTYPGTHQPLTSRATFDECSNRLNPNRSRKQKHAFPLRGYMTCAVCGCSITATTKKGVFQYYYCTNGRKNCNQHTKYTPASALYQQVGLHLRALQFDLELVEIAFKAAKEKVGSKDSEVIQRTGLLEKELQNVKSKQERLLNIYLVESISEDTYNVKAANLKREEQVLNLELQQISSSANNHDATLELTKKAFLTANFAEKDFLDADDNRKRSITELLLWNLTLEDQKVKDFHLKMPFQLMANFPKNASLNTWLGW